MKDNGFQHKQEGGMPGCECRTPDHPKMKGENRVFHSFEMEKFFEESLIDTTH